MPTSTGLPVLPISLECPDESGSTFGCVARSTCYCAACHVIESLPRPDSSGVMPMRHVAAWKPDLLSVQENPYADGAALAPDALPAVMAEICSAVMATGGGAGAMALTVGNTSPL